MAKLMDRSAETLLEISKANGTLAADPRSGSKN